MKHPEPDHTGQLPSASWIDRWMDSRWILLAVAMIAAAIAYPAQRQWRMEHDLEAMFRGDSPLLRDFQSLKNRFGGNEAVLGIFEATQLWESPSSGNPEQKNPDQKNPVQKTPAPLQQLDAIAQRWRAIDGVQAVVDLAMLDQWIGRLEKPKAKSPNTPADSPALLGQSLTSDSKLAQAVLKLFDGYTHRRGSPIVAVVALLDPNRKNSTGQLLTQMKSDAAQVQPADGSTAPLSFVGLVGEPVLVEEGFDLIERDGQRLTWSVTFWVGLVLGVLFRSIRWTVTACLVILWSMLVTRGLLAGLGFQLSMVSSMLGAIVSIVATATITHWIVDAQQTRRSGVSAKQALSQSLTRLWKPMLLAGLTDVVGFGSLAFSTVAPVRDYGLMMGVACAVVVAGIFLIAPALAPGGWQWPVSSGNASDGARSNRPEDLLLADGMLQRWLMSLADWAGRWRYLLATLGALVLVVSTVGLRWLESETDFLRNFDPDLPMVQAFQRVDRDLGGAGLWDIQLPLPDAIDAKWVEQVSGFQQRLTAIRIDGLDQPAIGKVLSLIDLDRLLKDSGALGAVAGWLPVQARWEAARALFPELIGSLWSKRDPKGDGPGWLRIQLRSPEGLSARQRRSLIDAVEAELSKSTQMAEWRKPFGEQNSEGSATGHYVLVQHLVESLLQDQWKCFGSAVLGIILVLWWSTGRLSWALVAMALHALPAIVLVGSYAWLGWKTDLGAALIASVSLGLSIDSAIHYLMAWRRHRDAAASERESIARCQMAVGPASIAATAALVIGFSSLLSSDFRPTASFGQMASITMGLGLLANLIGMPALLSTRRPSD
ncbi:MAG: efflux RND transporter permease subunit [Pirellulaceae bacterium]